MDSVDDKTKASQIEKLTTQLRVAIIDHPKKLLHDERVRKVLSDSIMGRQMGFERTIDTYITADKYDMISTHFLIYDVSELHAPRPLTGIRLAYADRCQYYGLKLPLDENILNASPEAQELYWKFRNEHHNLAECIGWFVDPDFSFSNSHIDLAQLLLFSLITFLLRQEMNYCSGATNELYKASRWVAKVGHFEEGHVFDHPTIPYPHKMTLVEYFYDHWLKDSFSNYGSFIKGRYEITPPDSRLLPLDVVEKKVEERAKILKVS